MSLLSWVKAVKTLGNDGIPPKGVELSASRRFDAEYLPCLSSLPIVGFGESCTEGPSIFYTNDAEPENTQRVDSALTTKATPDNESEMSWTYRPKARFAASSSSEPTTVDSASSATSEMTWTYRPKARYAASSSSEPTKVDAASSATSEMTWTYRPKPAYTGPWVVVPDDDTLTAEFIENYASWASKY